MDLEEVRARLNEAGLRMTPQRRAIIEVLMDTRQHHPAVSVIHGEVKKRNPGLSLSTVYTTLNELRRLGLIQMLLMDGRESRCETNPGGHIHLICEGCGKILDYAFPFCIDKDSMMRHNGFLGTGHRMEYYGYCSDCLQGQKALAQGASLPGDDLHASEKPVRQP